MDALIRFALGCLAGERAGPDGLDELRRAWQAFSSSEEFRALDRTITALVEGLLRRAESGLVEPLEALASEHVDWREVLGAPDAEELGAAWLRVSRTAEFRGLVASGAAIVGDVLARSAASGAGRGR